MSNKSNISKKRALLLSSVLFKNKRYFLLFLSFLILLPIIIFVMMPSPYLSLVIRDGKTEELLWHSDIKKEEWFSHQYIHSVEKSPVIEKFMVNEDGIILTMESWTKSFGAGLPYEQQGTVEMRDGFYVMKDLNRPIRGGLLQMKPSSMYLHTFQFREEKIILSDPPFVGNRIRIEVIPMSWYEVILGGN